MKAIIDENNWARCGRCRHKLLKILNGSTTAIVEVKCHSCKELNVVIIGGDKENGKEEK